MKHRLLAALALVFVTLPVLADAPKEARATIAYLRKLQTKNGGFTADAGKTTPSLRATSSALRALKYFGGEAPDRTAAGRFVESCYDSTSGGFADTPGGKPDVPTTAVGHGYLLRTARGPRCTWSPGLRFLAVAWSSGDEATWLSRPNWPTRPLRDTGGSSSTSAEQSNRSSSP